MSATSHLSCSVEVDLRKTLSVNRINGCLVFYLSPLEFRGSGQADSAVSELDKWMPRECKSVDLRKVLSVNRINGCLVFYHSPVEFRGSGKTDSAVSPCDKCMPRSSTPHLSSTVGVAKRTVLSVNRINGCLVFYHSTLEFRREEQKDSAVSESDNGVPRSSTTHLSSSVEAENRQGCQ
ncbi:unnamed protein product [Echinostoma caproni]|uniref:Uncharacterized protein n=1 Tax=Echinostoma caproni TaxID=27848 RepID=A0A183BCY2_9TREM|nr:unnamed protein product [Echinostoma caproni]